MFRTKNKMNLQVTLTHLNQLSRLKHSPQITLCNKIVERKRDHSQKWVNQSSRKEDSYSKTLIQTLCHQLNLQEQHLIVAAAFCKINIRDR